ncbi:MAG: PBS lyase [Deltaproteobacteria bacterium]|nr:PBS lyase [Deltaproteobacteria bacterium]
MEGKFIGRDIISKPSCPFCGLLIERPKELEIRVPNEMPVGRCDCGAVYAYDVTGHNLGIAMIDALVFGCNGDWDLAWDLLPEEDYVEKWVENYDIETHLIVPSAVYEGRRITGTLYFIRLHEDIREVTEEGAKRRLERATPAVQGLSTKQAGRKTFSKKEVEALVKDYKVKPLLSMARQDKRIIRDLQRLLYSVDKLLRWRAADVMGKVAAIIAQRDPRAISKLLQGLITSLSDTAASSWGSLDAMGEIISNRPDQFGGYMPQLYRYLKDRALLAEALRALGNIGRARPDLLRKKAFHFFPLLQDPDHEIRGYAAILLGNVGAHEAKGDLKKLVDDPAAMELYADGTLQNRTIGQLASEALGKLGKSVH